MVIGLRDIHDNENPPPKGFAYVRPYFPTVQDWTYLHGPRWHEDRLLGSCVRESGGGEGTVAQPFSLNNVCPLQRNYPTTFAAHFQTPLQDTFAPPLQ